MIHTYTLVSLSLAFCSLLFILHRWHRSRVKRKTTDSTRRMASDIIVNKADFQRHLNGCERRLTDLTKSLQTIEKFAQKLLIHHTEQEQEFYFNELNQITSQIQFLYSSVVTLDQSSFVSNGKKRLDALKTNLEKNRMKFEQIQQYARIKFGYVYDTHDFEQMNNNEQQEQLTKLIDRTSHDEQIELDLVHHHTMIVTSLEKDLSDLHGAFVDINRIVHEQGTIVDHIEQALTNTDEMVHEATENVQTAVIVKKRSSRIKWILIAIVIGASLLLILIIYVTLKLANPYRLK